MLARFADVWVVTRENNRAGIEARLSEVPERDHLRLIYMDLPDRLRSWKKGNRRARVYNLIWQRLVLREARSIESEVGFNAVWHLTMSTVWLGSLAPPLRKRPPLFEEAFRRLTELVAGRVIDGMSNERDGLASG